MAEKVSQLRLPHVPLLDTGVYTIAGHYTNRFTPEAGLLWKGFYGQFGVMKYGDAEILDLAGTITDAFDTAKIRGHVCDQLFQFRKVYDHLDLGINYDLQPTGPQSWAGEYYFTQDGECFSGNVRCVILPTVIHYGLNVRMSVNQRN